MLGQLLKNLQGETNEKLAEIPEFDSNKSEDAVNIAGEVVNEEVGKELESGNKETLMNLFSDNENSENANKVEGKVKNGVISKLISKLGIDKNVASKVATAVVPNLLKKVTDENKKTPEDDPSPLENLFKRDNGKNKGIGGIVDDLF